MNRIAASSVLSANVQGQLMYRRTFSSNASPIANGCFVLALAATIFVTDAAFAATFIENGPFTVDYGRQLEIPVGFGEGEFTLELRVRPDASFPIGPVTPQDSAAQRKNWFDGDPQPYSRDDWWFLGNFLIDGHNNEDFRLGTFSLQFYGGGRVRWLFGDGAFAGSGSHWAVQAWPAETTPSLLDGRWHVIAVVRRWAGGTMGADLELWVDGKKIASQRSTLRTNMRKWWDTWAGFRDKERGWMWGAEKQTVGGPFDQYEDFKGELSEARFWSIARAPEALGRFEERLSRDAPGLVGLYRFPEVFGGAVCNEVSGGDCIDLQVADRAWHWINPRRTGSEWAATFAYIGSAVLAGFAALRFKDDRSSLRIWTGICVGIFFLAAFTWFDVSLFLDQYLKVTARSSGWYESRTGAQWAALALLLAGAIALTGVISQRTARLNRATKRALYAAILLTLIAIVRAASLHFTDVLLDLGPAAIPLGRAGELAGACAVGANALLARSVRTASPKG